MAKRYSDLPDVDVDSPEVYETSDVSETEESREPKPEISDSAKCCDINDDAVDIGVAKEKFRQELIYESGGVADFLGNVGVGKLACGGYKVGRADETYGQKVARIARELEELKMSRGGEEEGDGAVLGLVDQLEAVIEGNEGVGNDEQNNDLNVYEKRVAQVFDSATKYVDSMCLVKRKTITRPPLVDTGRVLELESRIDKLESSIGAEALGMVGNNKGEPGINLQACLNDLARKISIVNNPQYTLDHIKEEVSKMADQVEQLSNRKKLVDATTLPQKLQLAVAEVLATASSPPDQHHKIDTLYAKLPQFETVNNTVPLIITRLKSLQTVQADIGSCVSTVSSLDRILDDMRLDLASWNESIDKLNNNIEKQEAEFTCKKHAIEEVVDSLAQRIDRLDRG